MDRLKATLVPGVVPILRLDLAVPAWPVVMELEGGAPSVRVDVEHHATGRLLVNPICLSPDELEPLAERLRDVLQTTP